VSRWATTVGAWLAAAAIPLAGQSPPAPAAGEAAGAPSALWVGGGFATFTGGDFVGIPGGPTFGLAYQVGFDDGATEAALGIDYSRYGGHGFVGPTRQFDYAATLRRRIRSGRPDVLLGVRFGYSARSLSVVEEPARTQGFLLGPALSARTPFRPGGSSFDASVEMSYHAYEELIMYASREYGTDQDGFRIVLRVGVLMPIG